MRIRMPPVKIYPGFGRLWTTPTNRDRSGRAEQRKVKIMRRTIVVLVAMALALVALGDVAYSDDHRPPETVLYKGQQELQPGRLGSYCWSTPSGPGGASTWRS
jgi:hypothetical protein